jgi:phage shock protein A
MSESLLDQILGSDGLGTNPDSQLGELNKNVGELEGYFAELDQQVQELDANLNLLAPYVNELLNKKDVAVAEAESAAKTDDDAEADKAATQVNNLEAKLQKIFDVLKNANTRLNALHKARNPETTLKKVNASLKGLLPPDKQAKAAAAAAAAAGKEPTEEPEGMFQNFWSKLSGKKKVPVKPVPGDVEMESSSPGPSPPPSPPPEEEEEADENFDPLGGIPVSGGRRRRTRRKMRRRKTRRRMKGGWQTPKRRRGRSLAKKSIRRGRRII